MNRLVSSLGGILLLLFIYRLNWLHEILKCLLQMINLWTGGLWEVVK